MTVMEIDGLYYAVADDGAVLERAFQNHAAAWRWIDRQEGEPISRAEHVAEWIAWKEANG
jgi:hypothetical protein